MSNKLSEDDIAEEDFLPDDIPKEYMPKYTSYLEKVRSLQTPMVKDVQEALKDFRYYNTRYYDDLYSVDFRGAQIECEDMLVRVHSNKLLLIALASGNSIMQSDKDIADISFVHNKTDRSQIKVRGKRKLGAKSLEKHTVICQVRLEGETRFRVVRAGVKGYLVEINALIKKDPNLLKEPKGLGYLAVVLCKGPLHDLEHAVEDLGLLSEDEYLQHLFLQRKMRMRLTDPNYVQKKRKGLRINRL